ncbi:MAG: hypothetical protein E7231_11605 [Cellulosilyticum sp.]|nr:hypothetical protein [Cellulosilyticum sp.]
MKLYDDPAFAHLDPRFVIHLQHIIDASAQKHNAFETLQGLIQVNTELNNHQIQCTSDMQKSLLNCFKDTLPKAQRKQFDTFFNMMTKMNRK